MLLPRLTPRSPRLALLCALFAAPLALLPGCRDCAPGHPCCEEGKRCACDPGVELCAIDCELLGTCAPTCDTGFDRCEIDCGAASCDALCSRGESCRTTCGDGCTASCHSASGCATECGDDCVYDCRSVSSCSVRAGANSRVHCESVGSCDAVCTGPCRVECPQSGSCELSCEDPVTGARSPGEACGDTSYACGGC